jgi:hypothetical protein
VPSLARLPLSGDFGGDLVGDPLTFVPLIVRNHGGRGGHRNSLVDHPRDKPAALDIDALTAPGRNRLAPLNIQARGAPARMGTGWPRPTRDTPG